MKKFSILLLSSTILFAATITGCKKETEEITKIEYIVPSWKGSLDSEPLNPQTGWAYYNTKVRQSFIFDGNSWQILSQDGKDGQDGINGSGIIWKGELSSAPSVPEINWAYFNTVDGNSYIYNGTKWDYLAKSGQNSSSGVSLWLGWLDSEPTNPSEGCAYYNSTAKNAYIYCDGSWQTLSQNVESFIWKGAMSTAPEQPETNWAYFNITDQTSYIWNGTYWDFLSMSSGGNTSITVPVKWLGTFTSAPTNSAIGNAYYNSSAGASYIFDGSIWQQISKDGIDGSNVGNSGNGEPSTITGYLIEWKGSSKTAIANPSAGWAYYNSQEKKSFIYDGSKWQIMAQDGIDGSNGNGSSGSGNSGESGDNGLIYMGETTETIDGVTYTVKSYADVYGDPYLYGYNKYYYIDGQLLRGYIFSHGLGANLDYKYTEFDEKNFSSWTEVIYYSSGCKHFQNTFTDNELYYSYEYYENGKTKSYIIYSNGEELSKLTYEYYTNGNYKTTKSYSYDVLDSETEYYENGNKKTTKSYSYGVLYSHITYYENGNKKSQDSYSNGVPSSSYTYYDNDDNSQKGYLDYNSEGILSSEKYLYSDKKEQLYVSYNSNGSLNRFTFYYQSGYVQYYFYDGYLYSYVDNKVTSGTTSSSYYNTRTSCTIQQALEKLNELRPN